MLQQTQVSTVLAYYAKFLNRFPNVTALALAPLDDVLALWSGLGYYSRARNMHRCAQEVVALHGGKFPQTAQALQTLSGIGPSTAAAIASFCFSERVAILDGNVKRVLSRVLGFADDLALGKNEKRLWEMANALLPESNLLHSMPRYTQGVMDLGATVCTRRKPQCLSCPVQDICAGHAQGMPEKYPFKTKRLKRSTEHLSLLLAQKPDGSVWLERRPTSGIWGGLYCLPVFADQASLLLFLPLDCRNTSQPLPEFKHVLTHKDMHLSPFWVGFSDSQDMPSTHTVEIGQWHAPDKWQQLGLPTPIRRLLEQTADRTS